MAGERERTAFFSQLTLTPLTPLGPSEVDRTFVSVLVRMLPYEAVGTGFLGFFSFFLLVLFEL